MNISRLSSTGGANVGAANPIQKPEVKPTEGSVAETPASPAKRLANYSEKVGARVQNAIDENKLSEKQVEALEQAAQEFQQLLARIGNAEFGVDGPKRHFLHVLGQFQQQVGSILNAASGPTRPDQHASVALQAAAQKKIDTLA